MCQVKVQLIGVVNCINVLTQGIDILMRINPNVTGIFVGAVGFSLGNSVDTVMVSLKIRYPHVKISAASDMLNIASSAFENDTDCIAAICGTGTSVLIKQGDKLIRQSGYGYLLDGAGSGYDIGRDAIRAVLQNIDGIGEDTALIQFIMANVGETVSDIISKVYKSTPSFIASLAQFVIECYRSGDCVSEKIITKNAKALADVINFSYEKYENIENAVISGGIVTKNSDFSELLKGFINPGLKVVIPTIDPILGACMQCARMCNIKTEGLMSKLKTAYNKRTNNF